MYRKYDDARERLIKIFEDTRNRCQTDETLSAAVRKANAEQMFFVGDRPLEFLNTGEREGSGEKAVLEVKNENAVKHKMSDNEVIRELRKNGETAGKIKADETATRKIKADVDAAGKMKAGVKAAGGRKPVEIKVSGKRSLEAASAYKGKKICVHNFASATNPGGGVVHGSRAQEECLCRCSTLYASLAVPQMRTAFYDRHRAMLANGEMDAAYNSDCIYTPGVMVFKSDTDYPELLPEKEWFEIDVVTCAAPNLRERPSNRMNPGSGSSPVRMKHSELRELHLQRAKRILDIAKQQGAEVLILGAFGCGAFQNPPLAVAEAYALALRDYPYDFETVEFAVYCSPGKTENYDIFSRILGR